MKEFILFFRMDIQAQPSAKQMEEYMENWHNWVDSLVAENKLAGGNHLLTEGKVLKTNNAVTHEPYTKDKESVAGYLVVKAKNLDGAVAIAKECPILQGEGTSVEVRQIA
jgi:hypothetical protein